ncbi:hypothetical protein N1031_13900 [Herbiconiux moechotypicola]|uniref:Uncharacterized protein n=1 Tax=Herbiconiux moechotypicola TaxID=637393 RepID=A0ABN3DYW8_9MICO|nr:hypothetical protein [Herbiconiux moechotypicola]MCS5730857.1 hypothetical protein [Herbiconiux moechotypicola]
MRRTYDTALADVVVVRREGPKRWRLAVHRFTGEVLSTTVLHVEGDFRSSVLRLVDRTLATVDLGAHPAAWVDGGDTWSAPLRALADLRGSNRVLI